MRPKQIAALFLCVLMLTFIAIGPNLFTQYKTEINKKKSIHKKSDWTGIITVWDYPRLDTHTGLRYKWIKSKIKQFEKANPGIYIEFREISWKEGPTLLKAAAKTGANPDIAPIGSDFYFMANGMLEPLEAYISEEEREDYLENVLDTASYNGHIYGLPWMTTGYTMLLNTDAFSEKNIPLPQDGKWTFEQFADTVKQLTYDNNGRGGIDVYGFNSFIEPGYYNLFGILLSDGARLGDPTTGKYAFYGPEALSGLNKLISLKKQYAATPPEFGMMNENQAWTAFLQGKTAIYTASSWSVPYLRNMAGDNKVNFTTANFPTGKAGQPRTVNANICSFGIFKQKNEAKRQKCIEFIQLLTSKDTQSELVNFGYFPVRKSGKTLYESDKEMYTIQQSLNFAESLPKLRNWDEIDMILQTKIKAAVNGEITPEQCLEEARAQIEKRGQ